MDLMFIRDGKKNTVIHHCAFLNQFKHIEFYIKYYRRNLENEGFTLSEIRSRTRLLLDATNSEGYTAAHYASFKGNVTVLKCLEKYEASLGVGSDLGMTLLHIAAQGDKINTVLHLHER
jgi:ankyrin repeat protein